VSKPAANDPCRGADRLVVGRTEAEGQQALAAAVEGQPRRPDDVAFAGVRICGRERVGVVELLEAVALRAGEPDRSLVERAVEGGEDRLGVVPVRGIRRRDRSEATRIGWPLVSSTVAESAPPLPPPPPPLPFTVESKRTYSCRPGLLGLGLGVKASRIRTAFLPGSVMYVVSMLYRPSLSDAVTLQAIPPLSITACTVYVMSRA
jgi:hypothetical protein